MSLADQILQFLITGITIGSIYAIIAIGFNIIINTTEVINFAQGEFVMLGAMTMYTFTSDFQFPVPLAFVLSVLVTAVIGIIFERLAINPAKDSTVVTLIIITIGASIFLRGAAQFKWGKDSVFLPPFSGAEAIPVLTAKILPQSLWILGITILLVVILQFFYNRTIIGKAMIACSLNKDASYLMGINVRLVIMGSFCLSAALGAVSGIIVAPVSFGSYDMGMMLGLKGFCAAVLGGLGSSIGAIAGGLLLGIIESLGGGLISSGFKDAFAFLVLLLVLFLRPSGLFGRKESNKV